LKGVMNEKLNTDWFDLKKYSYLKEWDLERWEHNLSFRAIIFGIIDRKTPLHSKGYGLLPHLAQALKDCPGIPAGKYILQSIFSEAPYSMPKERARHPFNSNTVYSTDLNSINCMLREDGVKFIFDRLNNPDFRWHELTDAEDEELRNIIGSPVDWLAHSERLHHVTVNLSGTDEQIKNDFDNWLTEYRRVLNHPKPEPKYSKKFKTFEKKHLSDWVEMGVLPYLDLELISAIEGKKITIEEKQALIFPEETTAYDRVKDSTKHRAEWLISGATREAMRLQLKKRDEI
jgi:hypothetical protein